MDEGSETAQGEGWLRIKKDFISSNISNGGSFMVAIVILLAIFFILVAIIDWCLVLNLHPPDNDPNHVHWPDGDDKTCFP